VDLLGPPPGACPAGTTSPEDVKPSSTLAPSGAPVGAPVAQDDGGRVWPTICLDGEGKDREVSPQELLGVVDSYTWEELGVEGDLLQAVLGRPFVFRAEPEGDAFSRIDPGLPDDIAGSIILDVRDGDFLLAVPVFSGGVTVLTSGDGASWAGAPGLGAMRWIQAAGRIGDRLAFLGGDREGRMLLALGDAGGWREVDLGAAAGFDDEPFVVDAAFGPEGVVAVVGEMAGSRAEQVEPNFHLVASRDGTTWSSRSAADVAGEPVASAGGVTVTDDGVVVMAVPEQERVEGRHLRQVALVGTYR